MAFSLFCSEPASFVSDLPLAESVERLKGNVGSSLLAAGFGAQESAVGQVSVTKVRLQRVIPLVGNSFKPIFVGGFEEKEGQVLLSGRFTIAPWVKFYMALWFGFLGLMVLVCLLIWLGQGQADALVGVLFCAGLAVVAYAMVWLGRWFWRRDVEWLSRLIRKSLCQDPGRRHELVSLRQPDPMASSKIALLLLEVMVALAVLACFVSAVSGVAAIEQGPQGVQVLHHGLAGRLLTLGAAGAGTIFLIALHRRLRLAWKMGWLGLAAALAGALSYGFTGELQNRLPPNQGMRLFFSLFYIAGVCLVLVLWGVWWKNQKNHYGTDR